jgi:ABC-type transport system involved in cytochrome c biogenesis permease component
MAFAGLALVTVMLSMQFPASPAQLSLIVFGALAYLMLVFCLFHGVQSTADCFTSEKREGTLGLLFLTDLKGYDVVFGKLAANSLQALFNLLSIMPLMALPILMGGVSFNLFWRFSLGLLNCLFYSLSAGLMASAVCGTDRRARSMAFGLVFMASIGLPLLCAILFDGLMIRPPAWILVLLALVNPLCPIINAGGEIGLAALSGYFTKGFGASGAYWTTLFTSNMLAWLFLLLACRVVPHSWQDKPDQSRLVRFFRWEIGVRRTGRRRRNEPSLQDSNPMDWLCRRLYVTAKPLHWILALELAAFLPVLGNHGMDVFQPPLNLMLPLLVGATVKWAAASQAVRPMIDQRREGSMELLLATPLPVERILRGARAALNRAFLPSLLWSLAVYIVFMIGTLSQDTRPRNSEESSIYFLCYAAGILFLFIDYHAIVSLAMWHGVSSKKPVNAAGTAVFGILILPWFLWYGSIIFYFFGLRRTGSAPSPHWVLAWWFFLGLASSFLLGATSHVNLRNRFRECAMQRFHPEKPGLFARLKRIFKPSQ